MKDKQVLTTKNIRDDYACHASECSAEGYGLLGSGAGNPPTEKEALAEFNDWLTAHDAEIIERERTEIILSLEEFADSYVKKDDLVFKRLIKEMITVIGKGFEQEPYYTHTTESEHRDE